MKAFDGTVIVVSHDREFLDGLVDKVYEFGNQRVVEHLGGIYDFLEKKKMDNLRELERTTKATDTVVMDEAPSQNKLSYEARKEQSKAIKRQEKAVADLERRIAELESRIAEIETRLATPDGAADTALYEKYATAKRELSETMDQWTEQSMALDDLRESMDDKN